jgi:GrpB-like predicted nucleotidyltransferase (UPF0157 family)
MIIILKITDDLRLQIDRTLKHLSARIKAVLPEMELHHIGATAIPGALTKGDLDVLLRVSPEGFPAVVDTLRRQFQVKQPDNWTPQFASFGDDTTFELPVGIQVVVKDSENDFLLYLRDYLVQNPKALAECNRLKMANADKGPAQYWKAKNKFLQQILATRQK